jgi:hypothetical protein
MALWTLKAIGSNGRDGNPSMAAFNTLCCAAHVRTMLCQIDDVAQIDLHLFVALIFQWCIKTKCARR